MIVQYAVVPIRPDAREEAIEALSELGEASREEEGVVEYRVSADIDDENTIRIFEQYVDQEAVDAHMTSDHFKAFQSKVPDFAGGEVSLTKYDVSETTELM